MLHNRTRTTRKFGEQPSKTTKLHAKKLLGSLLTSMSKDWSLHGYKLIQMLMDIGFSSVDQGNVYRTLRKLEKENLISSTWDTSERRASKKNLFFN